MRVDFLVPAGLQGRIAAVIGLAVVACLGRFLFALDLGVKGGGQDVNGVTDVKTFTGPPSTTPSSATSPRPAKPADLNGSWQIDSVGSTVTDGATYSGLAAAGAPKWLFITQPANGTLIAESAVNTGHTRFYRPGKSTTTDIASGTVTMTSSWTGKTLVAEGSVKMSSGAVTAAKEALSRDGEALLVEVTSGDKVSKFRYTRLIEVGPCDSWPTPCKKAPG